MNEILKQIAENILNAQEDRVKELVEKSIIQGIETERILYEGLMAGMNEVAILFKEGELFVPEVLMAAAAMNKGMEVLAPKLLEGNIAKKGKAVFVTVKGDLHDIGIKLVGLMMEGAGYEVINIGLDVPPEKIVDAVKDKQPDFLGMSSMLTTTMESMKDTIEALKEEGLYEKIKVMIGGAPVTEDYAKEIGAYYAEDASAAVELANQLICI